MTLKTAWSHAPDLLQPFPALSFSFVSPHSLLLPGYSPTLYPRPKLSPLSSQPQHLNHNLPSKSGSFFWDKPKSLLLQEDITDHFSLQRSRSPEFTEPMCHSFDKYTHAALCFCLAFNVSTFHLTNQVLAERI